MTDLVPEIGLPFRFSVLITPSFIEEVMEEVTLSTTVGTLIQSQTSTTWVPVTVSSVTVDEGREGGTRRVVFVPSTTDIDMNSRENVSFPLI